MNVNSFVRKKLHFAVKQSVAIAVKTAGKSGKIEALKPHQIKKFSWQNRGVNILSLIPSKTACIFPLTLTKIMSIFSFCNPQ